MPKELIIKSESLGVSLNAIGEILSANGNNQGGCGLLSDGDGMLHLLLQDFDSARYILESNNLSVLEERNVLVIIADNGPNTSLKLNGVIEDAPNFYTIRVPKNGSVKIDTHIRAIEEPSEGYHPPIEEPGERNPQYSRGCSQIIFDLLHSLRLTK